MGIKLTKTEEKPSEKILASVDGSQENMDEDSKLSTIKSLGKQAMKVKLDYEALKEEMHGYDIQLPENPDVVDLSDLNEKYALSQSALSRVSAIEMVAIDNNSRWERIVNLMHGYIDDKRSRLLLSEDIRELRVRQQDAHVRVEMSKDYSRKEKIESLANESESFLNMVKVKKKDLSQIVVNISRQVKVLSLDYEINNKPLN